jgi:hypothetical protein
MSGHWVPAPRQYPNRCFLTGLSSREHGPYYEVDAMRPYVDPQTRREGRMYWCFASWRTSVVDPDGPYAIVVEEAVQKRTQELKDRIATLEAALASDPVRSSLAQFNRHMAKYVPLPPPSDVKATEEVPAPPPPDDTPQPRAKTRRAA